MSKSEQKLELDWMKFCKAVLLGAGIGLLLSLLVLAVVAWGISTGAVDYPQGRAGLIASALFGTVVGTLAASKISGMHGLLLGCAVGTLQLLVQIMIGTLLADGPVLGENSAVVAFGEIICGVLTGLLLRKKQCRRSKRRKVK